MFADKAYMSESLALGKLAIPVVPWVGRCNPSALELFTSFFFYALSIFVQIVKICKTPYKFCVPPHKFKTLYKL